MCRPRYNVALMLGGRPLPPFPWRHGLRFCPQPARCLTRFFLQTHKVLNTAPRSGRTPTPCRASPASHWHACRRTVRLRWCGRRSLPVTTTSAGLHPHSESSDCRDGCPDGCLSSGASIPANRTWMCFAPAITISPSPSITCTTPAVQRRSRMHGCGEDEKRRRQQIHARSV